MPLSKTVEDMDKAGTLNTKDKLEIKCPACGTTYVGVQETKYKAKNEPLNGDPSICFTCGTVLIYHGDKWRTAPDNIKEAIFKEFPEVRQIEKEIKAAYEYRNN